MAKSIDRRNFMKTIGGLVVATAAGPVVLDVLSPNGASSANADVLGDTLPVGTPICLTIALDGGNDHLNTLVPVSDPWYFDRTYGHGALALDPATTLPLNGLSQYRLNRALPFIADRWNQTGDVAFVLGVGEQNKRNFSHFESMEYWQTADTTLLEPTGWLGRYNDMRRPASPLATVSLGGLRKEAQGATAPALVVSDLSRFAYTLPPVDQSLFKTSLSRMATVSGGGFVQEASRLISSTFDVATRVQGANDPSLMVGGPFGDLTNQLLQAAMLIRAGLPCQTYTVGFGPFDSHNDQANMQTARFEELNAALGKFFTALAGHARASDVFVMITSEFGRQVTANQSGGTDHGQGGMGIFIGSGVNRGVFGEPPTLDPGGPTRPNRIYDALKPTVDFRAMHFAALSRLSDPATAQAVLRAAYPAIGVFGPPPASPVTTTSTTVAPSTTTTAPAANRLPVASFTTSVSRRTVKVDGRKSKDPDGTIAQWSWQWGDGTTGSGSTASHTYARSGTYPIALTVADNKGGTGTAKLSVKVR
jgi:uncharacterized protein (DUF1501 family)